MKLENLVGKELCDETVEVRDDSDSYEEVVLYRRNIAAWNEALTDKLGSPLISEEQYKIVGVSEDVLASKIDVALELAKSYGGIDQGQTLYHGVIGPTVILILIWPWQDNMKVTLKKAIL